MTILKRYAVPVMVLASWLLSCNAIAVPIVPGGFADTEGESNNVIPFTNAFGGVSGSIDSLAFRLDAEQAAGWCWHWGWLCVAGSATEVIDGTRARDQEWPVGQDSVMFEHTWSGPCV